MNIEKILNDEYYYFLEDNHDVAFYSLVIGLDEYFETYHKVFIFLDEYDKGDKNRINIKAKESGTSYIKCYLNIAIHIQHFFELETKRLLEHKHALFAVDYKDKPLILNKLLNNTVLDSEDIRELKSIEFSEAINRLKKLVDSKVLDDDISVLFASKDKLLKSLNTLRNTIIHKGKRVMNYCELDEFFSRHILPFVKEILECKYYHWHLCKLIEMGVYDSICNIISEGYKTSLSYSKIALEKEMARCNRLAKKYIYSEEKEEINRIISRRKLYTDEIYLEDKKCPCCENNTLFKGREIIGVDYDELGDENSSIGGFQIIHIPIYGEYTECAVCGFTYNDFIDIGYNIIK